MLRPLVSHIDWLRRTTPGEMVSIVFPELVPHRRWEHLLHNETALCFGTAFLFRPDVVVIAVPFLPGHVRRLGDLTGHDATLDDPPSAALLGEP